MCLREIVRHGPKIVPGLEHDLEERGKWIGPHQPRALPLRGLAVVPAIVALDPACGRLLGNMVGIAGNTLIVTAPQDNTAGFFAGSSYVFDTSGTARGEVCPSCWGNVSPTFVSGLQLGPDKVTLSWNPGPQPARYDVVRGDVTSLSSGNGDFTNSVQACLVSDSSASTASDPDTPLSNEASYYLARALYCGVTGTYDSGASSQQGSRDGGINASTLACP